MKKCFSLVLTLLLILSASLSAQQYDRALDYFNYGKYYESIEILEHLHSQKPYDLTNSLLLIDNYINTSNFIKARELIGQLKVYYPKSVLPIERELTISMLENNEANSLTLIKTIRSFDNKNYTAKYYEALIAEKRGYNDRAIVLYEEALKIKSGAAESLFALSRLYQKNNENDKAVSILLQNQRANPQNPTGYYNLANIYYLDNNMMLAENQVNHALNLNPDYTDALLLSANIKAAQGLYQEAIAIINSIDDRYLGHDKHIILANLYDGHGDYESALANYDDYIKYNGNDEIGRYLYEDTLFSMTNDVERQKTAAANYYKDIANKYTKAGDRSRSLLYNKKILKLNPTDVAARANIAETYRRLGYNEKYLEELGIIKNLQPDNKSISYRYDSDYRTMSRNIASKQWGISQYDDLKHVGFSVAISPFIRQNFGMDIVADTAVQMALSEVLNQYYRFTTVDMFTNRNIAKSQFLNTLNRNNIDFYLEGTFNRSENSMSMDINLIDTISGKVVKNIYTITYGRERLINSSINVAESINAVIPFYASIIKEDGTSFYVDAGKWQSLTNGQKLAVYNRKPIYDYSTKAISTNNVQMIAIANVVEVDENVSKITLEDNALVGNIEIGQYVINYEETDDNANVAQ